jgi:hypothetical protein
MTVVLALVTSFTVYGLNAYVTPMPSDAICRAMVPSIERSVATNPDILSVKVECVTVDMPAPKTAP